MAGYIVKQERIITYIHVNLFILSFGRWSVETQPNGNLKRLHANLLLLIKIAATNLMVFLTSYQSLYIYDLTNPFDSYQSLFLPMYLLLILQTTEVK